ncbi:MAG TPA: metalloregulator ArsR/SmtB family transcription factor [Pseudonocardiaceae bacterium]
MDGFALIADASRRRILDLLLEREHDVGELVRALGTTQPNVSKHLRVLREAGLVTARSEGTRRVYGLTGRPLSDVEDWLLRHRERWNRHLDALERHLDARYPQAPEEPEGKP